MLLPNLNNERKTKKPIVNELLGATVLFALENGIDEFFGFMVNKIWDSTYQRLGFELIRIGQDTLIEDGECKFMVSAIRIKFDKRVLKNAGVDFNLLNYGKQ